MRCPFCKTQSQSGAGRCPTCGVGFAIAETTVEAADAGLSLVDGVAYLLPQHHYRTEDLTATRRLIGEYLEGEDVWDDALHQIETMQGNLERFTAEHVGKMQALLVEQASVRPDEAYDYQVSYLLATGTRLYGQACETLGSLLQDEDENDHLFTEALAQLQDGVDYLAFCLELFKERKQTLEKILAQDSVSEQGLPEEE